MSNSPHTSNNSFTLDSEKKTSGKLEVGIRGSKRIVKTYTIFDTEKKAYSAWNAIQNNSYNSACSFFFFGLGLFIQTIFSGWNNINPLAQAIACLGIPFSMVLGGIFLWRGWRLAKSTASLDDIIENETQHDGS